MSAPAPTELDYETPLARFMRVEGITAYEIARRSGISYKQVCAYRDGRALPQLVNAFKLDRASGGKVPPAAWLGTELGRKAWMKQSDWEHWQESRRAAAARSRDRVEAGPAAAAPTPGEAVLVVPR